MAWRYRAQFGSQGTADDQFRAPNGVAVSADGRTVWVADQQNDRISVWTRPTSTSTEWSHSINFGSGGSGGANFYAPAGVAVSADGLTVWVADHDNLRVSVWTRTTNTSTEWSPSTTFGSGPGIGGDNFNGTSGVAVSADGRTVWAVDNGNNRISVWTRTTNTSIDWSPGTIFGSQGSGDDQFNAPTFVAVSADGRTAWVADQFNNRISVWTRPTDSSTEWSHSTNFGTEGSGVSQFQAPIGVAVSGSGRTVWVTEYSNNRISVWTRPSNTSTNWSPSTTFGSYGSGDDSFHAPMAVAVSADGRTVWVADSANNRISIWTYS